MRLAPGIFTSLLACLVSFSPSISSQASAQKQDDHSGAISFLVAGNVRQGADGRPGLAELADRAAGLKVKPSFIIAVGNLTNSGLTTEFGALASGTKHAADKGITIYALPGSRDVSGLAEGKERFLRTFGKTYQSFDINSAHFILLDSTVSLRTPGHLDKTELDWLDRDLRRIKLEAPIFVFLYHSVGQLSPADRPLDNDYDLLTRLKGHNVAAIFTGDAAKETKCSVNGITILSAGSAIEDSIRNPGQAPENQTKSLKVYDVSLSQLLVGIDQIDLDGRTKPEHISNREALTKSKGSLMRVIWDDPDIPYLERRRPAATLSPRIVADNPDKERAEYRIDSGPWKPLIKDRRDIWSDTFPTKDIAIGIHTTDIRLTTSNDQRDQDELIFEVERDNKEATRKWAIDLPASIQSNPLLSGDSLYVSCNDGKLYAINVANGKRRWVFPARAAFVSSPVIEKGIIYIGSTDKTFYAVEASSGHIRWRVEMPAPILATAACAHGVVCFGTAGTIYALDMETGDRRWSLPADGPFEASATADGDAFYLGGWDNSCYALEASSGTERWHVKLGASPNQSPAIATPCVLNGSVYFAAVDEKLHCLDAANGSEKWAKSAPLGEDAISTCSPAVCGSSIIVCGDGKLGSVYSFDAATGSLQWHTDIGQNIQASGIRPGPNGLTLALVSLRGRIAVLNAAKGNQLWGYELGPGNIFSTPAYDGSMLYTTTMANDVQAINGPGVGK